MESQQRRENAAGALFARLLVVCFARRVCVLSRHDHKRGCITKQRDSGAAYQQDHLVLGGAAATTSKLHQRGGRPLCTRLPPANLQAVRIPNEARSMAFSCRRLQTTQRRLVREILIHIQHLRHNIFADVHVLCMYVTVFKEKRTQHLARKTRHHLQQTCMRHGTCECTSGQ